MNEYVVHKVQRFCTTVYAESEEDAESGAIGRDFEFVDEEYSVREVGYEDECR